MSCGQAKMLRRSKVEIVRVRREKAGGEKSKDRKWQGRMG